jgi:hypothetical protein
VIASVSPCRQNKPPPSPTLAGQGLYLTELRPDEADLETVFLELTAEPELEVAQ